MKKNPPGKGQVEEEDLCPSNKGPKGMKKHTTGAELKRGEDRRLREESLKKGKRPAPAGKRDEKWVIILYLLEERALEGSAQRS